MSMKLQPKNFCVLEFAGLGRAPEGKPDDPSALTDLGTHRRCKTMSKSRAAELSVRNVGIWEVRGWICLDLGPASENWTDQLGH